MRIESPFAEEIALWKVILIVLLAVVAFSAAQIEGTAQTRLSESQVKLKIRVVERQKCLYETEEVSCKGLELYRFQMSDGSIYGPVIGVPLPAGYKHDPAKWEIVSE